MSPAIRWHTRAPCATLVLLIAVLVGASLRMRCVLADREDKVAIEPKRMMLLKKVQRKLIQLPREELWNILARQQRHLNSVRQELDKKLTTESITSLRQKLAGAEENVLAFRLLCGLEDSVGLDDEKLIAKYYTNAIAATKTSDERAECQEREAKLDALMAKWSGLQDELQREVGELVQQRKDVKILQEAYERSKAYHQRMLDIVFLKDGPEKVKDLDALHQSRRYVHAGGENVLPVGEYQDLSDGMYVYPIYLLRDVCWDGNGTEPSEVETQSLCPPEILDMIRQLRDLQWEYNRVRFQLHAFGLAKSEILDFVVALRKLYAMKFDIEGVSLDTVPVEYSLFKKLSSGMFVDSFSTYSSRVSNGPAELLMTLRDVMVISSFGSIDFSAKEKLLNRVLVHKSEIKEAAMKLQVSLGLLYSETLLDPNDHIRDMHQKVAQLYTFTQVLKPSENYAPIEMMRQYLKHPSLAPEIQHETGRVEFMLNTLLASDDFIRDYNLSSAKSKLSENSDLITTVEEAYIARLHFLECFRSHNLKRYFDEKDGVFSSAHHILKERCMHHAENVIHVEMLKQLQAISSTSGTQFKEDWYQILLSAEKQKAKYKSLSLMLSHISSLSHEKVLQIGTDELHFLNDWIRDVFQRAQSTARLLGITLADDKVQKEYADETPMPLTASQLPSKIQEKLRNIRSRVHTLRHEVDVLRKQHPVQAMLHAESEWYQRRALDTQFDELSVKYQQVSDLDARSCRKIQKVCEMLHDERSLFRVKLSELNDNISNYANEDETKKIIQVPEILKSSMWSIESIAKILKEEKQTNSTRNLDNIVRGLKLCSIEIQNLTQDGITWHRSDALRTALLKMETIEILQQMEHSWLSLSRNVLDKNVYERLEKYNPMMDAVETVCERGYSKDKNFDIKDAVKSCPGEVIDRLKTLRALEYKLERLRFMVDYFSVKGDVRNDIFSILFRRMSTSLRVSSAAQTGFTTSMTKVVSQMNETYRVAMSKESESERMSALYACIQSDTLTDLVHFEDADGFFASTSNSVYLDYRIILFDMELIRGLFVGVEDLARDQYLRALLDVERQVTLHRHLLGLRSAPVLLTSGMLSKFHLNIQRMTSLHRLFVDVQALSANRPGISALQELVERSSTYNMDPRGDIQKELEKLSVTTQAAASGTPAAPLPAYVVSGVEPTVYSRFTNMIKDCFASYNNVSTRYNYVEMYMWFMDMFESVPRIPSALRLGLYALDRSVHLSDLIKKELVIHLEVERAIPLNTMRSAESPAMARADVMSHGSYRRFRLDDVKREVEGELHSLMSVIRALAKTVEDTAQTHTYQDDLTGASAQTLSDIGVPSGSPAVTAASAAKRKAAMDARERLRQGILKEMDQMQQDMNDAAKGKPKNKEVNMFDIPELVLLAKKRGVVLSGASKTNRTQKTEGWVVAVAVLCPLAFVALMGSILLLWHRKRRNQTAPKTRTSEEFLVLDAGHLSAY